MNSHAQQPEVLFEAHWEVCNRSGGVHSMLTSKAGLYASEFQQNFISIGPDVYRETQTHPEFIEDKELYASWRAYAEKEGLRVRIGRWKIPANPVVIIVDFTPFIAQKNEILSHFWERYQLDSLTGQWDYVEPVLFGYAAGKVIESFTRYHFTIQTKVVAHFQEWTSGAGILYLKEKAPYVATVFTAHDTVLGSLLAKVDYYAFLDQLSSLNFHEMAANHQAVSKVSIEKIAASQADSLTVVSSIVADEYRKTVGSQVDILTPNGIDLPYEEVSGWTEKRSSSRTALLKFSQAITGQKTTEDAFFVAHVSRKNFRNEGVDVFLEALKKLKEKNQLKRSIVAYVFVRAPHYGVRKEVLNRYQTGQLLDSPDFPFISHGLHDTESDSIVPILKEIALDNATDHTLQVIYVPAFLNGKDGLFNMAYSDLLAGFDLTVFPALYKAWGYSPLESISMGIPSIATEQSGFGKWVIESGFNTNKGLHLLHRNQHNDEQIVESIANWMHQYSHLSPEEYQLQSESAFAIAKEARWESFFPLIREAWSKALVQADERRDQFTDLFSIAELPALKPDESLSPKWHEAMVKSYVPDSYARLKQLAQNLWWTWNYSAIELWKSIDEQLWRASRYNPIVMLNSIGYDRFSDLEKNESFKKHYHDVLTQFDAYMQTPFLEPEKHIAYFSMEFGFHDSLKIFSGGLGILAGDYLKEASDSRVNMVGIGLLYRTGYFRQIISLKGEQVAEYPQQDFSLIPVEPVLDEAGNERKISVVFPGRTVYAKIWEVKVGRIKLYLLDTDLDDNLEADRAITHALYGGDNENRLKQEMILGVGGIRALDALGIDPMLYHCNEGHSAFIGLERLRKFIYHEKMSFQEAKEIVRVSTLFTTHTPVPAGHDSFHEDLLRTYMSHYPYRLKISWEEFLALGKLKVEDKAENFSMSLLAVNLSQEVNAVSWLHGEISKDMFQPMYPAYYPDELHISYVTNGVHYQSWTAPEWQQLYEEVFGKDFIYEQHQPSHWNHIRNVSDERVWNIHLHQKKLLIDYLKERVNTNWLRRHESPTSITEVLKNLDEHSLIIGFARRFATYKRAYLLFSDIERLRRILNDTNRPIIFLFAGKAHPNDIPGQEIIKKIVDISRQPDFLGKILFLENYDIDLAKKLVQGVDVWLNTPTRPLEASGTSGMKAVMNGGLHFSVLDGWWVEGYRENAGWALPMERTYEDQDLQNKLDAELLHNIIEQEIVPGYYDYSENGIPVKWVSYMKNSIAAIAPQFTMKRMIEHYQERFYNRLLERTYRMKDDDYDLAQALTIWKKRVQKSWNEIRVVSNDLTSVDLHNLTIGERLTTRISLHLGEVNPDDLSLELVLASKNRKQRIQIEQQLPYRLVKTEGKMAFYECDFKPLKPGAIQIGVRMFAHHADLPHRQDFNLVKWI